MSNEMSVKRTLQKLASDDDLKGWKRPYYQTITRMTTALNGSINTKLSDEQCAHIIWVHKDYIKILKIKKIQT